jgi:two-component system cell cycle response regulator
VTLRLKLIISFLMVSLITAGTVGASAWWLFQQDFRDSIREEAFRNFSHDIRAYINRFGSWETAVQSQSFTEFVRQQRPHLPPPPQQPGTFVHPAQPPFRFLLVSPEAQVVRGTGEYAPGQTVPQSVLQQGKAIRVAGKTVFYAIPFGEPILTATDQAYLDFFKHAINMGLAIAAVVAVLLGIVFGSRLVSSVRELTQAIKGMQADGEVPQPVPVRSRDEVGLLAESFNHMSQRLAEAHSELLQSNATISLQAEELQELSLRDPLTSLYNRRYFDDHAQILMQQAMRHQHPMCIMIADLDNFKTINDRFSHTVGDKVLRQTTDILMQNMRKSDLLARFGGEEFVALFVESTLAQARERCEILRKCIEEYDWSDIADGLQVTISIGLCDELKLGTIDAMLHEADRYLYQAKASGRNRVEPVE